jgi:hypothetical protein
MRFSDKNIFEAMQAKIDQRSSRVFSFSELSVLHSELKAESKIPKRTAYPQFLKLLSERGDLRALQLASTYQPFKRYAWGAVSAFQVALSLLKDSYLSHATAAFLHSLTDNEPPAVYLNKEQSPKTRSGFLTQQALERAFSQKQRQSKYKVRYENAEIIIVSGKNTGRLGVVEIFENDRDILHVTSLERTLIDISVRPAYAGGPSQVLRSFEVARKRVDTHRLAKMLRDLDYLYPYNQAIGFYMQKAGFGDDDVRDLRSMGFKYDFYLTHRLDNPIFDKAWRIFVPEDIGTLE